MHLLNCFHLSVLYYTVCGGVKGGALLNVITLSVWATLGHYDITPEDKSGVKLTNEPVYLHTHAQVAAQSRTSAT